MIDKKIDESTMENVEILAKLKLDNEQRIKIMAEMEKILAYVDKLNEVDTSHVEPLINVMHQVNVFRGDDVTNGDGAQGALMNAPAKKDNYFVVPKTM